jgi:DUF3014 family protein
VDDIPDYDLVRTPDTVEAPAPAIPSGFRVIALVFVIAAAVFGVLVWYLVYFPRHAAAPPAATERSPQTPTEVARPLGGTPEPVAVPPLDESDPVVRDLVHTITSHPAVLAWLATNGLIRNFTVVVANVVDGVTPARHLSALRPPSQFQVSTTNGKLFIDSRSYDRYNRIADAVASIDPAGASRVYATLKPRIQDAYAELGLPPASFDRALESAIVALLQTPVVDGPVRVEEKGGVGYRYADPALEALTGAQKHLLRTGPRNERMIQSALRGLARALGVPASHLPGSAAATPGR